MPLLRVVSAAVVLAGCAAAPTDVRDAAPWLDVAPDVAATERPGAGTSVEDLVPALSQPSGDAVAAAPVLRPSHRGEEIAFGADAGEALRADPPAEENPPEAEGDWTFSVTPYFWLFSLDLSKRSSRAEASEGAGLGDVFDFIESSADVVLMGHLEASDGEWTFFGDAELLDFSGDGQVRFRGRTIDVEYDLAFTLAEVGAARTLARFEGGGGRSGTVEVLGGARWNRTELDFDLADDAGGSTEVDPGNSWVDAFLGARVRVPVAGPLDLSVRGDAGGFGIGESSDVAWNLVAAVDVRLSDAVSVLGGWRRYKFEREAHGRETELILSGPFLGVVLRF